MLDGKKWYVRTEDGKVYGPADLSDLTAWAQDGRIEPSSFVSQDRMAWTPAQLIPELEMKWLVEIQPGKVFGPFNRAVVVRLTHDGEMPADAKVYRLYEHAVDQDPPPVERIVEKIVEKEVRVEVPVERIVEKEVRVEVPVEKIVEKIVEVPPPARTEIVVAEVVEPDADVPPTRAPGSLFKGVGRSQLAALEAAARQELANAKRGGMSFRLLGGKRK